MLNPPVLKIVENKKYVVHSNEYKDEKIQNNENTVEKNCFGKTHIHEDPNLQKVSSKSCKVSFQPSKNKRGNKKNLQNQAKKNKYGVIKKDSKLTMDHSPRNVAENEISLEDSQINNKDRLVHVFNVNCTSRNTTDNEKWLQKSVENNIDGLNNKYSAVNSDYCSRNTIENETSIKNRHKNGKNKFFHKDSDLSLDQSLKNATKKKKYLGKQVKNAECELANKDFELKFGSRNAAKSRKLFQNNKDALSHADSETSLNYPGRNKGVNIKSLRKCHRDNEAGLDHEDSERFSNGSGHAKKSKKAFLSALWKNPKKRTKNETKPKTM